MTDNIKGLPVFTGCSAGVAHLVRDEGVAGSNPVIPKLNTMIVELWGVRGSIAAPLRNDEYRQKLHGVLRHAMEKGLPAPDSIDDFIKELPMDLRYVFGGDTTCISITTDSEIPYIIDCGTGIRPLGDQLMGGECGKGRGGVSIFQTHTHWDHIQGLPFFKPLYIPGNEMHFYSPFEDIETRISRQMLDQYFPMSFEATASKKNFHVLTEETIVMPDGTTVDWHPMKHPGGSFAYRFRKNGRTFIFATDAEFTGEDLEKPGYQTDFFMNADLLILDSQYSLDEAFSRFDWGHTSFTMAVNCGIRWNVKNLVLTHHEPAYSDSHLYENFRQAIEHRNYMKTDLPRLFIARQGMKFRLG